VDYDDLRQKVVGEGDLYDTEMEELRAIHGALRLGSNVRDAISEQLNAHGLGHIPAVLPSYQSEAVRIYRLGTPIGDLVQAVQRPSAAGDTLLRTVAGGDAQATIRKIRELVCE
jgi:hypothetical protein